MNAVHASSRPLWPRALAAASALLLAGAVALFFHQEVRSTVSVDVTSGDVAWAHQLFHNATRGRLFETSVYHNHLGGVLHNPFAYANNTGNHVNLTPYLFAVAYRLLPTLSGYYSVCLLAQYVGMALFFWLAARASPAEDARERGFLLLSLLSLSCAFFWTATSNGLFPLYLVPFFAAMAYGLEAGRPLVYGAALTLGCLVSEDSSMALACFGVCIALFRPDRRVWGLAAAAVGAAAAALAVGVVQPAARVGMELSSATNMADRLHRTMAEGGIRLWFWNFLELLRAVAVFSPALAFAALVSGRSLRWTLHEVLPLALLAPASHWAVTAMAGGAHHWMPVFLCLFYALTRTLCAPGALPLPSTLRGLKRPAAAALAAYAVMNACGLYYRPAKHLLKQQVLPRMLGYAAPDVASKVAHNRRVLSYIEGIPPQSSVCFYIDMALTGYAASRSDFWLFPAYLDQTDLLVIDKDGLRFPWKQVPFRLDPSQQEFLASLEGPNRSMSLESLARLRRRLADSHRVVRDDADLLVLERRTPGSLPSSPTSRGLSFLNPSARSLARLGPGAR